MASNYDRLYSLDNNQFLEGCPVLLCAGALLKHTQKGTIITQLKFKSLSEKTIIALKVKLSFYNPAREKLYNQEFDYLDLLVERDEEFGSKTPIIVNNTATRAFDALVCQVVFDDGTIWNNEKPFEGVIDSPQLIHKKFSDEELQVKVNNLFGDKALYLPKDYKDIWTCVCGEINNGDEKTCHFCQNNYEKIFSFDFDNAHDEIKRERNIKAAQEKEQQYNTLIQKINDNCSLEEYCDIKEKLGEFGDFEDSKVYLNKCQLKIDELTKLKEEAERANKQKNKRIVAIGAIALCVCIVFIAILTKVILPNSNYSKALALKESGDYDAAITAFEALNGYKDSAEQIVECQNKILINNYDNALGLKESGDYDAAITAFEALNGYKDSAEQIKACKYEKAQKYIDDGRYDEAYTLLEGLGYKDSEDLQSSVKLLSEKMLIAKATVGSYVSFGAYEQNNITADGKEDIEWIVLAKEDNNVLLISKYSIDAQPFNTSDSDVAWNTSSLRKWLNGPFLNTAFSEREQSIIPIVSINTEGIGNTEDQIFLLDKDEVQEYFSSSADRKCEFTSYVYRIGVSSSISGGKEWCNWWLRTPSDNSHFATYVSCFTGDIYDRAVVINNIGTSNYEGVRPALWVSLGE